MDFTKLSYSQVTSLAEQLNSTSNQMEAIKNEQKLSEIKMMFITLPFAMFNEKYGNIEGQLLIDEFGNVFKIRGLEQIRFIGNTPSWYFECGKIFIDAPENIDMSIGEYFALESGDHK